MKLLLLTHRVPFPPNGGYPIVVYNTIKGLLDEGVELTLFSLNCSKYFVDLEDVNDPILSKINLKTYPVDVSFSVWDAMLNVLSNQSYNVSRFFDEDVEHALEDLLREQAFDLVQFEGLFVLPYLDIVKSTSNAKLIYRAHNIEHKIWDRLSSREQFTPRRLYLRFLARRLEDFESEQLNRFHQVFAISEPDRQKMLQMGCLTRLEVFPVAVDFDKYKLFSPRPGFLTLCYIGAMDWQPNKEGLEWFLDEIWPDIEKLGGDLRLYIAGKFMPKHFYEYKSDNVIVEGEVVDILDFIDSKSIMLVPLLSGSGMRVRIIEGMAMQKCVIATTVAAEGIEYTNGKDIMIADTADEFYRAILTCVTQPKRWQEIGRNARDLVEKQYNINTVAQGMAESYRNLLA